jgi:hypothetical protein
MKPNRPNCLILAGCQIVLLCGVMLRMVSAAPAADSAGGTQQLHPLQLAQQEFFPSKWPGKDSGQSANQGMGSGSQAMMPPGMGPGGRGMMPPGMGPGARGMMGPGMGPPAGQPMMGPGMGPVGQGMMGPGPESGRQPSMGQNMTGPATSAAGQGTTKSASKSGSQPPKGAGMMGPAMGPGGPGMMAGPMGGSPMAELGAIGALDLSDEQRSKYDAINQDLNKRMQELTDRMNSEGEKLRKLQQEQMRIGRTLGDLRAHMLQAGVDAANRADELLTDEQRQSMYNQGRPFPMQPRVPPPAGSQGGNAE